VSKRSLKYNISIILQKKAKGTFVKKIAYIFPGQGSQRIGMAKELYEAYQAPKEIFEEASEAVKIDFKKLMFEENENLGKTEFTQPAILLASLTAQKLFENAMPIKPIFAFGHSLGEFSAVASVGALSLSNAVFVVHERGKLMSKACNEAGMMVVLGLADKILEDLVGDLQKKSKKVWCANYNTDGQVVIAGLKKDLCECKLLFKKQGAKRVILLDMSVASHCPLMQSAAMPLAEILREKLEDNFLSSVISNVNAKKYKNKAEALDLLPKQLISPVLYKQSVLAHEEEVDMFIEFGGSVLSRINKKITKKPTFSVSMPQDLEVILEEIGK